MNIYDYSPRKLRNYFEYIGENPAKAMIIYDGIYRLSLIHI